VSRIFEDHIPDPSTREADMIKSEGCSDYATGSMTNVSGFDSLYEKIFFSILDDPQ